MATQLFLRDRGTSAVGRYRDLMTTRGPVAISMTCDTTASGTQIQFGVGNVSGAGAFALEWISGRSPVGGWTLSGTVTFNIWGLENSMSANIGLRARLFKITAAGSESEIGGGPFDDGVEMGTSSAAMNWTGTPSSTAFSEDDRLIVRIYITNIGTMGGGFNGQMVYNGPTAAASGDSYIQLTETVTFKDNALPLQWYAHFDGADASTSFPVAGDFAFADLTRTNNAEIDTAQSVFGGASCLFNGSGGGSVRHADANATSHPMWNWDPNFPATIDFRFRTPNTSASIRGLFGLSGSSPHLRFYLNASFQLVAEWAGGTITSSALSVNTWYHVAFTVDSSADQRLFINGTQHGSTTNAGSNVFQVDRFANNQPQIGAMTGGGGIELDGWIDEVHADIGLARWTANFTPPSTAYPIITATETVGSSTGSCTVTGVGQARTQTAGSTAGTCNVNGVGSSRTTTVGSAAGTCTVTGVIRGFIFAVGTAAGTCTVTGIAVSTAAVPGSAAGTCTVSGVAVSRTTTAGNAAGSCTVTGVSASTVAITGSAAGTSTVTGLAVSTVPVVGSAAGTCTVSGVGDFTAGNSTAAGSAAGTCTVTGIGVSTVAVPGTAAGTCTVTGTAQSLAQTAGTAAGTCTVAGVSSSRTITVGSVAGSCTVTGIAVSSAVAVGSAAGTCTVTGIAVSSTAVVGNAAGTCTVTGTAQSLAQTVGSAAGTSIVTGVSDAGTTVGTAAGTCTVIGIAVSTVPVVGSAAGTCTVTATSQSRAQTVGSAAGTCTVTAIGVSLAQSVGSAAGTCTVTGVGVSRTSTVGNASGTCTVTGVAASRTTAVGVAAGTCSVTGTAQSLAQTVGNAAGSCTVTGVGLAIGGASETQGSAAGTCTVAGVGASTTQTTGNASGSCTVLGVLVDANSTANPGPTVGSHGHFFITMGKLGWIKRAA